MIYVYISENEIWIFGKYIEYSINRFEIIMHSPIFPFSIVGSSVTSVSTFPFSNIYRPRSFVTVKSIINANRFLSSVLIVFRLRLRLSCPTIQSSRFFFFPFSPSLSPFRPKMCVNSKVSWCEFFSGIKNISKLKRLKNILTNSKILRNSPIFSEISRISKILIFSEILKLSEIL